MSKAIVVLTRGYNEIAKYDRLILRNINISKNLNDLSIEIIIFHEGNILENHQSYIKSKTPLLNIKFINVKEKGKAFIDKSYIKRSPECSKYYIGYCHMCSFWFVNFWNYVEDYDYILRIDEDCIIDFNINDIFNTLENKVACYGTWVREDEKFVKDLYNFNVNYFKINNLPMISSIDSNYYDKIHEDLWTSNVSGPYTNIFGLNLSKLRNNENMKKYIETIKYSDYIYIHRWGDLPLWGTVLEYFFLKDEHIKFKNIKYIHDGLKINMD
jgi:hypothetical protein